MKHLLLVLLLVSGAAGAADLSVVWKNATTYTDGSAMPSTDIVSSTVSCGLSQTTLTLTGKGVVNNIDARCLGRIADDLERQRGCLGEIATFSSDPVAVLAAQDTLDFPAVT